MWVLEDGDHLKYAVINEMKLGYVSSSVDSQKVVQNGIHFQLQMQKFTWFMRGKKITNIKLVAEACEGKKTETPLSYEG